MNIKWSSAVHMQPISKNNVTFLSWEEMNFPGFTHGFSTRLGGVSQGIFSSMNLSFTRGDDPDSVMENYRRISDAIGFSHEDIVCSDQTHTKNVRIVTALDRGNGIIRPKPYKDVDGMITNVPGLVLATFFADCVPLFFIDPVHKAIGLSHSGWRGTVARIGLETVRLMQKTYGTDPADIHSAIGPSICQDCYEVSQDVIEEFSSAFDPQTHDKLFYARQNGKYQLNLWEANRLIMTEAGIPEDHIHLPGICTCCNPEFLFSHRASHGKRGNLAAFLCLDP